MNNEDLQRLYNIGIDRELPGDFVRRDKNGKIPGGLTLNKYTWTLDLTQTVVKENILRLQNIISSAKGRVMGSILVRNSYYDLQPYESSIEGLNGTSVSYDGTNYSVMYFYVQPVNEYLFSVGGYKMLSSTNAETYSRDNSKPSSSPFKELKVTYYNDTEITA